jgi:hypothetical protein
MKFFFSLSLITTTALLIACTPHPTSGVWKATVDNDYGIDELVIAFDGKAHFTSTKKDNAVWHCFWTASSEFSTELKCTPSTNPDQEEEYTLTIGDQKIALLRHNAQLIASFTRLDKNPSPKK